MTEFMVFLVIILIVVGICVGVYLRNSELEKKYSGIHYYENFSSIWEFISDVMKDDIISLPTDKRKKCNMYIEGNLYENTNTYYELTQSSFTIWYGNLEHRIDLSKLQAFKLKDGTTSIYSEIRKTRQGQERTIREAFVCGDVDNKVFVMSKSGPICVYYEDKIIVILPYNSPTLASEQPICQSSVDLFQYQIHSILTKLEIDDLNTKIGKLNNL